MMRNTRMQRYPVGRSHNREPPKNTKLSSSTSTPTRREPYIQQVLPDFLTSERGTLVEMNPVATDQRILMTNKAEINPVAMDQRILMTNKAVHVGPESVDFAQITSQVICPQDKYQNILLEQYGFDPLLPETISYLKKLKVNNDENPHRNYWPKVDNSSQYANPDCNKTLVTSSTYPWFVVDSIDDVDNIVKPDIPDRAVAATKKILPENLRHAANEIRPNSKNVRIANTPRMKVIAERYARIKKDNFELRRLEEKIVCLEYDVFALEDELSKSPIQIMRAFFSIKTGSDQRAGDVTAELPSTIRTKMEAQNEDFRKVAESEVEMLDANIIENKPYLDDLKRVLKKKQALYTKKKKSTIDLRCMYEMARHELPPLDHDYSNTNLLSKSELQEIKDLILQKCESRLANVSRKPLNKQNTEPKDISHKSDSIFFYDALRNFVE